MLAEKWWAWFLAPPAVPAGFGKQPSCETNNRQLPSLSNPSASHTLKLLLGRGLGTLRMHLVEPRAEMQMAHGRLVPKQVEDDKDFFARTFFQKLIHHASRHFQLLLAQDHMVLSALIAWLILSSRDSIE